MKYTLKTSLSSPAWLRHELKNRQTVYHTDEEMMTLAIAVAHRNVTERTGGPFGAALFEKATGKLITVGVNSVLRTCTSIAHAESMAIIQGQTSLGTHDLSTVKGGCILASSAQPCSQCTHIIWWSGISELLIGARTSDVQRLTKFNEGHVPKNIVSFFATKSANSPIPVRRDILRQEACKALALYTSLGGINY